jgi:hypothetical protein
VNREDELRRHTIPYENLGALLPLVFRAVAVACSEYPPVEVLDGSVALVESRFAGRSITVRRDDGRERKDAL